MNDAWIADRMKHIDASGIRKAFDMAKAMKDPINLSIGLPDFDVAEPGQGRGDRRDRTRATTPTPSPRASPSCASKIQAAVDAEFHHADRQVLVTAGHLGRPACWRSAAWSTRATR